MARMRATQIYLPEDLAAALDRLARAQGTSRASLIRAAARGLIERQSPSEDDPIWGIVGLATDGPRDTAADHDRLLVEEEILTWQR